MKVVQHHDAQSFSQRARPLLLKHECENGAVIGVADRVADGSLIDSTDPMRWMLTVEEDENVRAVAIQTRPHSMLTTRMDSDAVQVLAQALVRLQWPGRGFNGPAETSDALAKHWSSVSGQPMRCERGLRVFQLDSVVAPRVVPGRMIIASADHLELVTEWRAQFAREIGEPDPDPRPAAERAIVEKRLFLWDDNGICSMTGSAGPTPNGIRINYVYTPPALRGRGYASNLVAGVSRQMLDSGRKFCFLFTDMSNPTSNKIYQQLGYQAVTDFRHWQYTDGREP